VEHKGVTVDMLPKSLEYPADQPVPTLMKAGGCNRCSNTGYRGRVALHEIMLVDEAIERLTVGRASTNEILRAAQANGMETLIQDGWAKVVEGITSIEELMRVAK